MKNRLRELFNVREDEGPLVVSLLFHSFLAGLPRILIGTAASTLFLQHYSGEWLPFVYIMAAVINPLIGVAFTRLSNRISFDLLILINLSIQLLSLWFFWGLFQGVDARWPAFLFAIWFEVLWVLSSLQFWGLAGHLFDVRQGKRLFSLIGSGEVITMIVMGVSGRAIINAIGVYGLILVASGGVIGSLLIVSFILRRYSVSTSTQRRPQKQRKTKSTSSILKNQYVVGIGILAIVSYVAFFFVDNAFYTQVQLRFPDDSDALAGFLIVFVAFSGVVRLASQLFISERVITRFGVGGGLLVLPVLLTGSTLGVVISAGGIVFWFAALTKLFDQVFRYSIQNSARLILYQPLPERLQVRFQALVESTIEPITGGLTGIILLILFNVFGLQSLDLYRVLVVILVLWMVTAFIVSRRYYDKVLVILKGRNVGTHTISFTDSASLKAIREGANSSHMREVIYALNMLESVEDETLNDTLVKLLQHRDPLVKIEALKRIEKRQIVSALPPIRLAIKMSRDIRVKAAAVQTLTAMTEDDLFNDSVKYLDDDRDAIRFAAMVGLIRNGGIEGVLVAGERLIKTVESADVSVRKHAAYVLGEIGIRNFYRPLLKLLQDDEETVRYEAIRSAGKLQNPRLLPFMMQGLESSHTRGIAISALMDAKETAIPEFRKAFSDERTAPAILIDIARICGRIRHDSVIDLLWDHVNHADLNVRLAILSSLSRYNYMAQDAQSISQVHYAIHSELKLATWYLAALLECEGHVEVERLASALEIEFMQTQERLFYWLSFLYESRTLFEAHRNYMHGNQEKRAYALEALDHLLEQDLKLKILPIFDNLPVNQKLKHLSEWFSYESLPLVERVYLILVEDTHWVDSWIRASAIYSTVQFDDERLVNAVAQMLSSSDSLILETARWATRQFAKRGFDVPPLDEDGDVMLLTIEKVIILKGVTIFSETPEELLVNIAYLLEGEDYEQGEVIVNKGDDADCMYIIVEGRVKIHDDDHVFAELAGREFFGDMALLDDQTRSATVTALEPTHVLRLDQADFQEIIRDYPEVAHGILRVLSQRLRSVLEHASDEQKVV